MIISKHQVCAILGGGFRRVGTYLDDKGAENRKVMMVDKLKK